MDIKAAIEKAIEEEGGLTRDFNPRPHFTSKAGADLQSLKDKLRELIGRSLTEEELRAELDAWAKAREERE